jgi:hypothetical protein
MMRDILRGFALAPPVALPLPAGAAGIAADLAESQAGKPPETRALDIALGVDFIPLPAPLSLLLCGLLGLAFLNWRRRRRSDRP